MVVEEEEPLPQAAPSDDEEEEVPEAAPPRPSQRADVVWEINTEEIEPFLYFDASITHRTGHIKKDRLESLLFSLGHLTYREVQELLQPINLHGPMAVEAWSNTSWHYQRACSTAREVPPMPAPTPPVAVAAVPITPEAHAPAPTEDCPPNQEVGDDDDDEDYNDEYENGTGLDPGAADGDEDGRHSHHHPPHHHHPAHNPYGSHAPHDYHDPHHPHDDDPHAAEGHSAPLDPPFPHDHAAPHHPVGDEMECPVDDDNEEGGPLDPMAQSSTPLPPAAVSPPLSPASEPAVPPGDDIPDEELEAQTLAAVAEDDEEEEGAGPGL